ncbi:tRNA (5-methylaminomethyl-2-thiouridine)(34)-methyltransferase MnmD [Pseudoruegeria sp. HB172150]|uniref:tRNA (5-methylaminomethyl-2-thiouridine)(34)-methyltransferase MnmD n=1 Tax=Pseudoruegeria sp. HB172150 TaxID=2721164 RepID=UPI001553EB43|nr:tRNA (5-methylaminomethyl-2-thiouridine)(34)-methyltransferase MnmD [Pseudoruegeria sp. HB172150]
MPETQVTEWKGAVPVSTRFDDPYYSLDNGLAETRHVFLAGNGLPGRFTPGFRIAELGFGTGLNMLTALQAWRQSGTEGRLRYTSFEAFPLPAADLTRALEQFPELAPIATPLIDAWTRGDRRITTEQLDAEIIEGDARKTLSKWNDKANAWFLDGFSPAKNPELWEADLLTEVARHTAPGGTAATYTAAGFVRRNLEAAGFAVTRSPGFGRKRHMTTAVLT